SRRAVRRRAKARRRGADHGARRRHARRASRGRAPPPRPPGRLTSWLRAGIPRRAMNAARARGADLLSRFVYASRTLLSRPLFAALRKHSRGDVLDVGGREFFLTAVKEGVPFDRWTTLEPEGGVVPAVD